MGVISMKALLEAGVHFGHQTRRWNPKMAKYIYTSRNGIHIIDLQKTSDQIDIAYKGLFDIAAEGGKVMFVGTKKQSQEPVKEAAVRSGQYYVDQRWLGGTLTNFKTIKHSIKKLHDLYKMESDGTFDVLPKKEVIGLRKDMARLEKFLGGIKEMKKLPQALFIIDPRKERNAILEARKLGIPVFGIVDTNCDPDEVDFIIPANDDALRSVRLIVDKMADAVIEANGGLVEKDEEPTEENVDLEKDIEDTTENKYGSDDDEKPAKKKVIVKVKPEPKSTETKTVTVKAKPAETVKKVEVKVQPKVEKAPEVKVEEPAVIEQPIVVEEPAVVKETKVVEETKPALNLDDMTVADLRNLAKENNLTGYSKLKKSELIDELKKVM